MIAPDSLRKHLFSKFSVTPKLIAVILAVTIILFLILMPLTTLLFSSLRDSKGMLPFEATGFTLNNYIQVLASPVTYRLLLNTLIFGSISLVIGFALAMAFAWFVERTDSPGRRLLMTLTLASMGVPPIVDALAWVLLANPTNGVFNVIFRNIFGMTVTDGPLNIYSLVGIGIVVGLQLVPSSYILIASVIGRIDPRLEEASLASGASPLKTLKNITAALMRPAVLGVIIYNIVLVIGVFEIPGLLGIPRNIFVFSTLIYDVSHPALGLPNYSLASAYAIINLVLAGGLIYLYNREVRGENRFAVVTGKAYQPRLIELKKRWQFVFIVTMVLYILFSTVIPFMTLLWASLGILHKPFSLELITLEWYKRAFSQPEILASVWNTLVIGFVAATGTMSLALLTAWLAVRTKFWGNWLPNLLTLLVLATPSIVLGLAFVLFYTRLPIPIYGTIWIIVIAFMTRYIAFTSRLMHGSYIQLHQELEEASKGSGAGWLSTIRLIVLPLLWPAISKGWLWVFVHCLTNVALALMLFVVDNHTITVRLWQVWTSTLNFELGAAIAVPLMLVAVVLSFFMAKPSLIKAGYF